MIMRKQKFVLAAAVVAGLFLAACSTAKAPAQAAIQTAESALAEVGGEASKYVPEQFANVKGALDAAKGAFEKGDFKAALAGAQALPAQITALKDAAMAKKAEFEASWSDLGAGLPQVVEAIRSRVDILSQARTLPKGMTPDQLAGAKSGLESITAAWTEASSAAQSGDLMAAVGKAAPLKAKAAEVMTALGMEVPEALR